MQSQSVINDRLYYDIIAIGNHAAVAADRINCSHPNKYKIAVLHLLPTMTEPYTSTIGTHLLTLQTNPKSLDIISKTIERIQPKLKMVVLQDGEKLAYKFLLFGEGDSGEQHNYKQHPLGEALDSQFSRVYSSQSKNEDSIFQNEGNLVFYVPSGPGTFRQNYPFLKIADRARTNKNSHLFILLEGNTLYPHCPQADLFLKQKLKQSDVTLIENAQLVRVDYLRRVLYYQQVEEKLQLPYESIYCFMTDKIPKLLQEAEIDPFACHKELLHNTVHDNIYILGGDYLPSTHSFNSLSLQIHHVSYNLAERLAALQHQRMAHLATFNGYTSFHLQLDSQQTVEIRHSYDPNDFQIREIGCCWGRLRSYLLGLLVKQFYNFYSFGPPHYLWAPALVPSEKWEDQIVEMSEVAEIRRLSHFNISASRSRTKKLN